MSSSVPSSCCPCLCSYYCNQSIPPVARGVYFQQNIFEGLGRKKNVHPFWYFNLKLYLFSLIQRKLPKKICATILNFWGKKYIRKGIKNFFRRCRRWLSSVDLQVYQEEQRLSGIYDNLQFAKVQSKNDRLVSERHHRSRKLSVLFSFVYKNDVPLYRGVRILSVLGYYQKFLELR